MSIDILEKLWSQYMTDNPHAKDIYDLFVNNGENPENDHIALRTLSDDRINIYKLAQAFISKGYKVCNDYDFEVKKLKAIHLEHSDENQPKVFISQLLIKEFSDELQQTHNKCINSIPEDLINNPEKLLLSGVSWQTSYEVYKKLLDESEYAAWFYAFGFRANHFTVFINQLKNFNEVSEVNYFLKKNGFKLNSSGGEIKGSQANLLEQSSTMSGLAKVDFYDGKKDIPSCYYEFAKRYKDSDGKLYQGFVAKSADKIFESTNIK
ncbi:DUF1338 domain-containing protein [Francisella halioticida]|uniref:2-oxoadipate dioxygenase/decarboxylase n=1 Tax=Francisella halioticida TaxID=549298 RepID=A0ABN5B2C3_9GAMM|nr:DUF1338 domain-containing protein [Francisella halioticida]ASG67808.1 succinyldiaminopimelate aminotransferase [Francisella halioticida]BCD90736.1 DUF1338 domain-containing protein [Francisella halioticida]